MREEMAQNTGNVNSTCSMTKNLVNYSDNSSLQNTQSTDTLYDKQVNNYLQNNYDSDHHDKHIKRSVYGINKNYNDNRDDEHQDYYNNDDEYDEDSMTDEITGINGKTPNYVECKNCEYDNTYSREFFLNNEMPCPIQPINYTDNELQNYRDDFFNFRNKTYQTSHGVDAIDILNEKILAGEGEFGVNKNMKKGQKISEIYDGMMASQYQRPDIQNPNTIHGQPNYDEISMAPRFKMNGGNGAYYTKDSWLYKNDRIMNGGEFYDGITGSDGDMSRHMAISYN
jgi:hypothetical protein